MEKTLMFSLENHNIYYITDSKAAFYIAIPYRNFNSTNITIELRNDTSDLVFNSSNINNLIQILNGIYAPIDKYNISLIIPVMNSNFIQGINNNVDEEMYNILDKAIAKVINYSYVALSEKQIKVDNDIIMINNNNCVNFMRWFTNKYNGRCKYKAIQQMIPTESKPKDNLDKVELSGINFVVGREEEEEKPTLVDNNAENIQVDSSLILNEVEIPEDSLPIRKEAHQAGYVSYYLLGVISIGVSLAILYFLI